MERLFITYKKLSYKKPAHYMSPLKSLCIWINYLTHVCIKQVKSPLKRRNYLRY